MNTNNAHPAPCQIGQAPDPVRDRECPETAEQQDRGRHEHQHHPGRVGTEQGVSVAGTLPPTCGSPPDGEPH
ncbi:hypothetical protein ACWEK5_20565 [Rhodococcus koreensis]